MKKSLVEFLNHVMMKVNFSGDSVLESEQQDTKKENVRVYFFVNEKANSVHQPFIIYKALKSIFGIDAILSNNASIEIPSAEFHKYIFSEYTREQAEAHVIKEVNHNKRILEEFNAMLKEVFPDVSIKDGAASGAYYKSLTLSNGTAYDFLGLIDIFRKHNLFFGKEQKLEVNLSVFRMLEFNFSEIYTLREELYHATTSQHKLTILNAKLKHVFDVHMNYITENMTINSLATYFSYSAVAKNKIMIAEFILNKLKSRFINFKGSFTIFTAGVFTFEQYNYAYLEAVLRCDLNPLAIYELYKTYDKRLFDLLRKGIACKAIDVNVVLLKKLYDIFPQALANPKRERELLRLEEDPIKTGVNTAQADGSNNQVSDEDNLNFAVLFNDHFSMCYNMPGNTPASSVYDIKRNWISSQLEYIALVPESLLPSLAILAKVAIVGSVLDRFIKPFDMRSGEAFVNAIKQYIAKIDAQDEINLSDEVYENLQAIAVLMESCLDNECKFAFGSRSDAFLEVLTKSREIGLKIIRAKVANSLTHENGLKVIALLDKAEVHPLFALRKTQWILATSAVGEIRDLRNHLKEKLAAPAQVYVPPSEMRVPASKGSKPLNTTPTAESYRRLSGSFSNLPIPINPSPLVSEDLPVESEYMQISRNLQARAMIMGRDTLLQELILTALDAYESKQKVEPLLIKLIEKKSAESNGAYANDAIGFLRELTTVREGETISPLEDLKITNPNLTLLACLKNAATGNTIFPLNGKCIAVIEAAIYDIEFHISITATPKTISTSGFAKYASAPSGATPKPSASTEDKFPSAKF